MSRKTVTSTVKDERLIEKRRSQMIKAAVELFTEKGFHRTTTREIARASGFSIGTLYEYIRTKEDVLYLVCDDIYQNVSRRLETAAGGEPVGLEALSQAIAAYIRIVDDLQNEILVMYQETKALSGDAVPYVLNKEREMAAIFRKILAECREKGEIEITDEEEGLYAQTILVQCQMWAFRRWEIQKSYPLDTFIEMQTNLILSSLKKHAAEARQMN